MKANINKDGVLEIERAGKFKEMACPFHYDLGDCKDDCALFGEPYFANAFDPNNPFNPIGTEAIKIDLCHKSLLIKKEDFSDERPSNVKQ